MQIYSYIYLGLIFLSAIFCLIIAIKMKEKFLYIIATGLFLSPIMNLLLPLLIKFAPTSSRGGSLPTLSLALNSLGTVTIFTGFLIGLIKVCKTNTPPPRSKPPKQKKKVKPTPLPKDNCSKTFNRQTSMRSPWQILSAESAKVILPFCALASVNFTALLLNWRVDGIAQYNTAHQIIFITICAAFLGSYDIRHKRQEFMATQPITRTMTILSRVCYLLFLVVLCSTYNYLLFSGLAEEALYQEIWMHHTFHRTDNLLLFSSALITFSLAQTAQTLTGVLLSIFCNFLLYALAFITETSTNTTLLWSSLSTISVLLLISTFYEYRLMSQVQIALKSIETFTKTCNLFILVLIVYTLLLFLNQEGVL